MLITGRTSAELHAIATWGEAIVLEKPFTIIDLESAVVDAYARASRSGAI